MKATASIKILTLGAAFAFASAGLARSAAAQSKPDMGMMGMSMDPASSAHMRMTPPRAATHQDTVRALTVAAELKRAIAKYQDTAAAVRDGYRMFLPNVKNQRVFHFTNTSRAFEEAFRFNPEKPTSVLYKRGADGKLHLIGAMYTMPQRASLDRLNARVPLSIARWHQHVNWCLPKSSESRRYGERMADGAPKFGPDSPIATKAACDAVGGEFHPTLFGWMLHANVYDGAELSTIFGDEPH
ncbi:MAG TPA: hypothetical protein VN706_14175 [Gemmatimonadaceae bacterium]|nr:hypothetical protein [Gemmatimonadaceae bacterium]